MSGFMSVIAIFPFQTRRTDAAQGIYARQIPRLVSALVVRAGAEASFRPWFARRGDTVAHVLVEDALPADVVIAESESVGAERALIGRSRISEVETQLGATLVEIPSMRPIREWTYEGDGGSIGDGVRDLTRWLLSDVGLACPTLPTSSPKALRALLFDMDNDALVAHGGIAALREPRDGFTHLVEALLADPDVVGVRETLQGRRQRWLEAGRASMAVQCAVEVADALGDDAAAWRDVATLSSGGDARTHELALRRLVAVGDDPAGARLSLGVFLLHGGRADEALAPLREASSDAEQRDAAETYLGVALASIGEVAEAVEYWSRVAREGRDRRIVRIAEENLERARLQ